MGSGNCSPSCSAGGAAWAALVNETSTRLKLLVFPFPFPGQDVNCLSQTSCLLELLSHPTQGTLGQTRSSFLSTPGSCIITGQRLKGCCIPTDGGLWFGALQVSGEALGTAEPPCPSSAGCWDMDLWVLYLLQAGRNPPPASPGLGSSKKPRCPSPALGQGRQSRGIAFCVSLLPHCLPQSILLWDVSVSWGGEGDVTGVRSETACPRW